MIDRLHEAIKPPPTPQRPNSQISEKNDYRCIDKRLHEPKDNISNDIKNC